MTAATSTSPMGVDFLERHEGVVLKAYRCPAGVWTIGAGLTKASGVVVPGPGMRITRDEASRLLKAALARNYEPRVRAAMPGASQREFDGAVSFDFNTGAIHRASWVASWKARDWVEVRRRLLLWTKGGGKVLPGLVRRRQEEFELMHLGRYGGQLARPVREGSVAARLALDLSPAEIEEVRRGLSALGYQPGERAGEIAADAVRRFQRDHDLTIDGVLGRATLSTLQRRLDVRRKAAAPAAAAAGGAAGAAVPEASGLPDWAATLVLAVAALWALRLAWVYRDVIAAKVQGAFPAVAARLRSIR